MGIYTYHVGNSNFAPKTLHDVSSPMCIWNKDSGTTSLNDELGVVEIEVIIQDYFGGFVDIIQAIVTQNEDIQFQICSLRLSEDISQAVLQPLVKICQFLHHFGRVWPVPLGS